MKALAEQGICLAPAAPPVLGLRISCRATMDAVQAALLCYLELCLHPLPCHPTHIGQCCLPNCPSILYVTMSAQVTHVLAAYLVLQAM